MFSGVRSTPCRWRCGYTFPLASEGWSTNHSIPAFVRLPSGTRKRTAVSRAPYRIPFSYHVVMIRVSEASKCCSWTSGGSEGLPKPRYVSQPSAFASFRHCPSGQLSLAGWVCPGGIAYGPDGDVRNRDRVRPPGRTECRTGS